MVWINQNHSFQQEPGGFQPITFRAYSVRFSWAVLSSSIKSWEKAGGITNDLTWTVSCKEKHLKKKSFLPEFEGKELFSLFLASEVWQMV